MINIYIFIIILTVYLLIQLLPIKKEKKNLLFVNLGFLILFIILAIRKPIIDMDNYFSYFSYLKKANIEQFLNFKLEFLYKVLNIAIAHIWFNKRFFMFVIDIITMYGVYFCVKKYAKNYLVTILLFVAIGTYYMQFFILRQAIAIAILLYSIKYISEKKLFKFILCVLIATLFHKTSIVFILAYFVCNIKFNLKYLGIWLGIWMGTFLFKSVITSQFIIDKYKVYGQDQIVGEGYGRLLIFVGILCVTLCIDYLIIKREKTEKEKILNKREITDEMSIFYNLTLLTILFQILATQNDAFCRLANIFCVGSVILLPNMISQLEIKQNKQIFNVITVIAVSIYTILRPSIVGYLTIL